MTDSDIEPNPETGPEPSFAIPRRPERRYSHGGGLSYEGTTVFALTPDAAPKGVDDADTNTWLRALTERVLGTAPYTYGDWFDLPMPVFLVHDRETGDVFRVAIRDGTVEFHVLPETEPEGLCALYERLCEATGENAGIEREVTWRVTCRTDADQ